MDTNAPAPATPEVAPAPAPVVAPTPAPAPQMADGGAVDSVTSGKMNWKDIVISVVVIAVGVLGAIYYRKAIKKLDDQVTGEEFDNLAGKVDEHDANLKKALGSKYKKM
jgi:predicted dienelactone hydrolase